MIERPLELCPFSVERILAHRKTQTRRVMIPQPVVSPSHDHWEAIMDPWHIDAFKGVPAMSAFGRRGKRKQVWFSCDWVGNPIGEYGPCPYGDAGNQLWARERWKLVGWNWDGTDQKVMYSNGDVGYPDAKADPALDDEEFATWLLREYDRVTGHSSSQEVPDAEAEGGISWKLDEKALPWRPGRFMWRWMSRITLPIWRVRVQRLQDISQEDAQAEGVDGARWGDPGVDWVSLSGRDYITPFRAQWDSLNAKRGYPWTANPFVWVIEWERFECKGSTQAS
jgi:hypothetical protein